MDDDPANCDVERFSIATEKKPDGHVERMPVVLFKPKGKGGAGRLPVVIMLHGTGGNKDAMRDRLERFVEKGMIAMAIDARYHGERSGGAKGSTAYVAAATRAWETPVGQPQEHPWFYDTVWDLWRLLDYLVARPDVDAQRIGMMGISMGGIQTWLAASVDERVSVAVPAISVQSLRWSLENEKWQGRARTIAAAHEAAAHDLGEPEVNQRVCRELWNKIIPGMLDEFDCPSMLRLFASRPLLILNGELDPNCPLDGAQLAFDSVRREYDRLGASDRLRIDVAAGVAHKVTEEQHDMALAWFGTLVETAEVTCIELAA